METLTRLVTDSLARHGFDRPMDPRRLQWSRWFRCDSPHSLLVVPSKPGIFAIAEEIAGNVARVPSPATSTASDISVASPLGGAALQRCDSPPHTDAALAAQETPVHRMLAVLQFSEDDDMAFTLDRMFTRINPMRARLSSGSCFLRFVVIEDQDQRRSICSALNQWMLSSAEKASGIPAAFSSSMEVAPVTDPAAQNCRVDQNPRVGAGDSPASVDGTADRAPAHNRETEIGHSLPHLNSGANTNLHCPHPLPSGF
ncbi:MAG: hypothetical protein WAM04_16635 [Candidatus Sulfotelmatobacter sp.]